MNDEEIVQELSRGNTTVLKYCYKKTLGQVEGMVMKNGGSREDAKDLFHDALIVFNAKCKNKEFKLSSSISTYLYAICRYSWLNEITRKKKSDEMIKSTFQDIEELTYKTINDPMEAIMRAINLLGDKCKEILLDYYYGKLSYEEIAVNLDYASGQVVRQQKYRCIQKLKETTDNVAHE